MNIELKGVDNEDVEREVPIVTATRFPQQSYEGLWIAIGDSITNTLHTVRHVMVKLRVYFKLRFADPKREEKPDSTVSLVLACYIDCDQEESLTLVVPLIATTHAAIDMDGRMETRIKIMNRR